MLGTWNRDAEADTNPERGPRWVHCLPIAPDQVPMEPGRRTALTSAVGSADGKTGRRTLRLGPCLNKCSRRLGRTYCGALQGLGHGEPRAIGDFDWAEPGFPMPLSSATGEKSGLIHSMRTTVMCDSERSSV
jgi:hypothetical protein